MRPAVPSRSSSSPAGPASGCGRSPGTEPPRQARLPRRARLDGGRSAPARLRRATPLARHDLRRARSWPTRATTPPASSTRPRRTASRSRRWPGRPCSSDASVGEARAARPRDGGARAEAGRDYGTTSATPAGDSTSTRRRRLPDRAPARAAARQLVRHGADSLARLSGQTPSTQRERRRMDDATIHERIEQLVARSTSCGSGDEGDRRRDATAPRRAQVALDQAGTSCGSAGAGRLDPEDAARPDVVENYRQ